MENDNMPSVADIQAAFGITPDDGADPEPAETGDQTEAQPDAGGSDTASENESDNTSSSEEAGDGTGNLGQDDQNNQKPADQTQAKQNQAFAKMRTENSQMYKALTMMAKVLGVDPNQPIDKLSEQLNAQAMGAIAKANNMDPAILKRLDQLEAINAEYTKARLENEIKTSLDTIGKKYGATEDDLAAFVQSLITDGYDVAKSGADLELEFIRRNFETIRKRDIDAAIQSEQDRSAKGSGASKPSAKQGQDDKTEPHNIDSVEALDKFFEDNAT